MRTVSESSLVLEGCAPVPVSGYLKALGVLRLVAEQVDASARGSWKDETFQVVTVLDQESLIRFFLEEYRPSPIVAPWNGRSGFWGRNTASAALQAVADSVSPRLEDYRRTIAAARGVANHLGLTTKKPVKQQKQELMRLCRSSLPDAAVQWIDAAFLLGEDRPRYPALLGTGANDGNMDFTANFMQNLALVVDLSCGDNQRYRGKSTTTRGYDQVRSEAFLRAALFGHLAVPLLDSGVGQFNPGAVGGPNSTQGFEGGSLLNPWDYVLTLEGCLVFAGSVVWRLSTSHRGMAAFPFTVEPSAVGCGSLTQSGSEARAETWMPLWDRPASYPELRRLFAEGRAQVGRRHVQNGVDFARAVAGLGVDRGIGEFLRYGFLQRSGRTYLCAPLGRMRVVTQPHADAINEIDKWLDSLRRITSDSRGPESLKRALRSIEDAIFAYCSKGSSTGLAEVLKALGRAERVLASSVKVHRTVRPLSDLSSRWITACIGSLEFRLALGLASIHDDKVGALRSNLEPVVWRRGQWQWAADSGSVVPAGGGAARVLAGILERRNTDASRLGLDYLPIGGRYRVSPEEIGLFLEGCVDDGELLDLLWAVTAIRLDEPAFKILAECPQAEDLEALPISRAYALLKLLVLPQGALRELGATEEAGERREKMKIPHEPAAIARLRAGDIDAAVRIAVRRLSASGLRPLATGKSGDVRTPDFVVSPAEKKRMLAALLFPVKGISRVMRLVIRPSMSSTIPKKGE
jgi:CRISPR-associated protein Csx17